MICIMIYISRLSIKASVRAMDLQDTMPNVRNNVHVCMYTSFFMHKNFGISLMTPFNCQQGFPSFLFSSMMFSFFLFTYLSIYYFCLLVLEERKIGNSKSLHGETDKGLGKLTSSIIGRATPLTMGVLNGPIVLKQKILLYFF